MAGRAPARPSWWMPLLRAAAVLLALGAWSFPALAADAPADAAAEAPESPAELLLFETDHLAAVPPVADLEYRFTWTGESAFTDRVILHVVSDPQRRVEPDYLSGGHHVDFPPVSDAHGNPLLLYFLESDLREMQLQTHGHADYFRHLIRLALARPDLPVESVDVDVQGRTVHAKRIVFAPFHADANSAKRYPELADKTYEFVLSTEVPGQIVQLSSRVAVQGGTAKVARVEWTRVAPPGAAPAKS